MQNWKFVRLFDTTATASEEELLDLIKVMSDGEEILNGLPAGYTYFGQFLAHDLTHLRRGELPPSDTPVRIKELMQARRPALDLDSLYGGGLDDSIVTYTRKTGKFVLGKAENGKRRDLFRRADGTPLIADSRNDENLLVAQMHVLFMRYHNRLIDYFRSRPGGCWLSAKELFIRARREAILSYQYITLHDFAKELLPEKIYEHIVENRRGALTARCERQPIISVEFAGAAFRFGHSMVQKSYKISDKDSRPVDLEELIAFTRKNRLGYQKRLPEEMIVDWRLFFKFLNHPGWSWPGERVVNQALQINTSITPPMKELVREHGHANIADLNLRRGRALGLATGQEVCAQLLHRHPDVANDVELRVMTKSDLLAQLAEGSTLRTQTPLWAYVLSEAEEFVRAVEPLNLSKLGILGGWLVADGLMTAAHYADVQADERWSPETSVINQVSGFRKTSGSRHKLTLEDLIVFTHTGDS